MILLQADVLKEADCRELEEDEQDYGENDKEDGKDGGREWKGSWWPKHCAWFQRRLERVSGDVVTMVCGLVLWKFFRD